MQSTVGRVRRTGESVCRNRRVRRCCCFPRLRSPNPEHGKEWCAMRRRIQVVRSVGVVLALAASVTVLTSTAQARPIGCGSVVTRSVVLTHDLLGCQGDGLVIGAGGITVNLGGHTVAGLVSDDSVGIRNAGHADVVVKNGVVRQFERGMQLTGVSGNRLGGLTVELNGSDGIDQNRSRSRRTRRSPPGRPTTWLPTRSSRATAAPGSGWTGPAATGSRATSSTGMARRRSLSPARSC